MRESLPVTSLKLQSSSPPPLPPPLCYCEEEASWCCIPRSRVFLRWCLEMNSNACWETFKLQNDLHCGWSGWRRPLHEKRKRKTSRLPSFFSPSGCVPSKSFERFTVREEIHKINLSIFLKINKFKVIWKIYLIFFIFSSCRPRS